MAKSIFCLRGGSSRRPSFAQVRPECRRRRARSRAAQASLVEATRLTGATTSWAMRLAALEDYGLGREIGPYGIDVILAAIIGV